MARQRRKRLVIGGASALVVAAILGVAGLAATGGQAQTPPRTSATATPSLPTPTPPASPTPAPVKPKPPIEEPMAMPFGPLAAEPYRVKTGDGDCLNVRPSPGTTFKSDPRTCVPEGFLLWLLGPAREVDGHSWRYALGEGWVATQYVVPAPGAATGFGPFKAVTVSNAAGPVTKVARVTSGGAVAELPSIPDIADALGDVPPALSPDGRWTAYGSQVGYVPTLTIREMATGAETKYPQVFLTSWSPAKNRLLVRINANCPADCSWTTGWIDPQEGIIHRFADKKNNWWAITWAPDGGSLYVVDEGALTQVSLAGESRVIVAKRPEGSEIRWGQLAVSEDGKRLLSSPFQGAITIVDLRTGAVSTIERATQIPVLGKCGGGGYGALTGWLDAATVIWHESFAEKGGNGITIANVNGGSRKLIPFFTVSDIRKVAPDLVSFTTYENPESQGGFFLTWLLDIRTGEARPVTVGATPAWE
ncbi:MAG: hypothetical protein IPO51_00855 [Dehalococcoidia bacterium]|nr:hypothetical protein [Dehalococcoidia bacterium]